VFSSQVPINDDQAMAGYVFKTFNLAEGGDSKQTQGS
jgi:hypothetical protein